MSSEAAEKAAEEIDNALGTQRCPGPCEDGEAALGGHVGQDRYQSECRKCRILGIASALVSAEAAKESKGSRGTGMSKPASKPTKSGFDPDVIALAVALGPTDPARGKRILELVNELIARSEGTERVGFHTNEDLVFYVMRIRAFVESLPYLGEPEPRDPAVAFNYLGETFTEQQIVELILQDKKRKRRG